MVKWFLFFIVIPCIGYAGQSEPTSFHLTPLKGPLVLRSEAHRLFENAYVSPPSIIPAALLKERRYRLVPLFQKSGGGMRFNMNF